MSVVFGENAGFSGITKWLFAKFVERSNIEFEHFVNNGSAYTSMEGSIKMNGNPLGTDDTHKIHIINYYSTSFRNYLPNGNINPITGSQMHGLAMICILSGIHNVGLKNAENKSDSSLEITINLLKAGSLENKNLHSNESTEILKKAMIIFSHEKLHLFYMALSFLYQEYSYKNQQDRVTALGKNCVILDFAGMQSGMH